jgi:hypothetical protein
MTAGRWCCAGQQISSGIRCRSVSRLQTSGVDDDIREIIGLSHQAIFTLIPYWVFRAGYRILTWEAEISSKVFHGGQAGSEMWSPAARLPASDVSQHGRRCGAALAEHNLSSHDQGKKGTQRTLPPPAFLT